MRDIAELPIESTPSAISPILFKKSPTEISTMPIKISTIAEIKTIIFMFLKSLSFIIINKNHYK